MLGIAVFGFAIWQQFSGEAWWLIGISSVIAFFGVLTTVLLRDEVKWYAKPAGAFLRVALSTIGRAALSCLIAGGVAAVLVVLAIKAKPHDTAYYEVRVYDGVDLREKYQVGTLVTLHTRTDGLTHRASVSADGGAVFRSLQVPTTLRYQLDVLYHNPALITGGNATVDRLPDQLAVDIARIPSEARRPLVPLDIDRHAVFISLPPEYQARADVRGDRGLEAGNAPWGVPSADMIINRLGYVLGYDLERRTLKWVAYAVGVSVRWDRSRHRFQSDPVIPSDRQAGISEYRRSGFDRGHMISPSDVSFKGPVTVAEAYYMSTVTPQVPWLNQRLWLEVEKRTRTAVRERQPVYVIAGPLFLAPSSDGKLSTFGKGKFLVPTHFFRIAARIDGSGVETFAVIVPNVRQGSVDLSRYAVSIQEIEKKSGLGFFPFLSPSRTAQFKARVARPW